MKGHREEIERLRSKLADSTERLKALVDEVRRISTQLSGDQAAIYEQLEEACNEAEGIEV